MDPATILALIQLGQLGLQTYLKAMELAGKTREEIRVIFLDTLAEFQKRDPAQLSEVK